MNKSRHELLTALRNSLEDSKSLARPLAEYCQRSGIEDRRMTISEQRAAAHFALDRILDDIGGDTHG